jgi:hypothetical protein
MAHVVLVGLVVLVVFARGLVAGCVVFVVGVAHLRKKTSVCCEELVLCSWLHVGWCGAVALAVAVGVAAVVV